MTSKAPTVTAYLNELTEDRRAAFEAILGVIRKNLDPDIEEGMMYGMVSYHVPLKVYPKGYHCNPSQPLPVAAVASQKGYISLYMMSLYSDPEMVKWFEGEWAKTGIKLNMGKSCIRLASLAETPLDLIGKTFKKISARKYILQYESNTVGLKGQKGIRKEVKRPRKKKA